MLEAPVGLTSTYKLLTVGLLATLVPPEYFDHLTKDFRDRSSFRKFSVSSNFVVLFDMTLDPHIQFFPVPSRLKYNLKIAIEFVASRIFGMSPLFQVPVKFHDVIQTIYCTSD